jgi:hypothetical protein
MTQELTKPINLNDPISVQVEQENPFETSKVKRKLNTKDCRILFLYPNERGMSTIPPSITSLSQILKDEGHQTALFDTTFLKIISPLPYATKSLDCAPSLVKTQRQTFLHFLLLIRKNLFLFGKKTQYSFF